MRYLLTLSLCLGIVEGIVAEDRGFRFTTTKSFLPAMKAVVVVKAGDPGPGSAKHRAVATTMQYEEKVAVSGAGPFDLWWQPKEGIAVKILGNLSLKEGEVRDVKLDNYLGVVILRGDGLPRPGLVTLTTQDDPGPDEKGHIPVQTAKEFRVEMVVPVGFYAIYATADNGARPKRVNDRFKVDAGKTVTLD